MAATLTVNVAPVAPTITTQPASQTVTAGQTATFVVAATGTAPMNYQWKKSGTAISGATSSSYTTPATTSSDNGAQFTVVVSNTAGTVTSTAATLTVSAAPVAPTITTQPGNQTVTAGQTATFAVAATGTAPLSYQWQKNGANISGATLASYTTPATTTADSGSTFAVVVTNIAGTVTSGAATLTVNAAPVAPTITTQPGNQTVIAGQTATFGVAATGTAPLNYQWKKSGTAISGATSASYTTPATTSSDNGAQFTVVVSNTAGSVTSNVATLTVSSVTTPPSVPSGLSASAASSSQINLTWNASTGGTGGIAGYRVYRGGSQIATTASTSYNDSGLAASTSYTYNVAAYDTIGNTSAQSAGASATTLGSSGGGGGATGNVPCGTTLPCSLGWYQIPNSNYSGVCPTYSGIQGGSGCAAVANAWGSAWADQSRSQMLLFGGGHVDYFGNEVYKLDLTAHPIAFSLARDTTHGSNLSGPGSCSETNADGTPNSRHDNDGMVYLPTPFDRYFIHGGNLANCGAFTNNYWNLSPSGYTWTKPTLPSTAPNPNLNGSSSTLDYDPVTAKVYMVETNANTFWKYDPSANAWTALNTSINACDTHGYEHTSVIDPIRRLYFCFGVGDAYKISLNSPYGATTLSLTGCTGIAAGTGPGAAYYPPDQTIVFWNGGNSVYEYNPDTDSCTTITYTGGPGSAQSSGTYKRFAYFAGAGGFLLVPDYSVNAFFLRLKDQNTENFQYRANQPGVLSYQGFDAAASFTQPSSGAMSGMFYATATGDCPSYPTTPCIVRDTSTYVSGGSSMRFDIKPFVTQDGQDYYYQRFGCAVGVTCSSPTSFGANSTFYIQFAFRADANWVNTFWPPYGNNQDTAPKLMIVHPSDASGQPNTCTGTQTVLVNEHGWGIPTGYISCGAANLYSMPDGVANQGTPVSYQGGWTAPAPFTGYQCDYQSGNRPSTPNCFLFSPNTWYTVYYKISLGTISAGAAPVSIEAYVGPYGQQLKKFINVTSNLTIPLDTGLNRFNALTLTQYMTGKTASNNPAASVWYDELIISTQPIPAPAGTTP